ncbi:biotin-dependent carboxyltransferase family protein [Flavimaricola marinus]|uniref:KipI antagonist n=1 Tax=Flavimaricola marinus TaxID=1819565 RepID=A0A238LKI7_9RHOB|nr:biotin-dependent carboxyltransferase family protein [Flavimaricola marinus]SMY10181.1 KipI antagonist [Flavimaricola marinus]
MIEVVSIPPLATVQDLGRDGYWPQGLGRAGAMDPLSHKIANMMLGNEIDAATLEIPMTPARFTFKKETAFAVVGAPCNARLNDTALPRAFAGFAHPGDRLELGAMTSGARVYIALPGGIDVPVVLGSRSTQLRETFGGYHGRVLASGDQLRAESTAQPLLPHGGLSLALPPLVASESTDIVVRALPSAEHDHFTPSAIAAFWSEPYSVTNLSNRQGYRLEGPILENASEGELRSHGIVPGIVQVPRGGQPIVQLSDSATMGGYPKIAAVIEQDLWKFGQARPGDSVRFEMIDLSAAAKAASEEAELIEEYRRDLGRFALQIAGWS